MSFELVALPELVAIELSPGSLSSVLLLHGLIVLASILPMPQAKLTQPFSFGPSHLALGFALVVEVYFASHLRFPSHFTE